MKVVVRIDDFMTWEKRKKYAYVKSIDVSDKSEYDFAWVSLPKDGWKNKIKWFFGFHGKIKPNELPFVMPVLLVFQRPHEFKKGQDIEVDISMNTMLPKQESVKEKPES